MMAGALFRPIESLFLSPGNNVSRSHALHDPVVDRTRTFTIDQQIGEEFAHGDSGIRSFRRVWFGRSGDIKRDREIIALVFPEILAARTVLLSCFLMRKWRIFLFRTVECQIG